jgi:hypothetical protein
VDILLDVISRVESALREGWPRTTTGVFQRWFSGHFRLVFFNTIALPRINIGSDVWGESSIMTGVYQRWFRLLCTSDGVCVIVYVQFSSVGAGTVWGEGSSLHSGIEFGRSRTGEGSSGERKKGVV